MHLQPCVLSVPQRDGSLQAHQLDATTSAVRLLSCKETAVEPADGKVDATGDAEEFVHPNVRSAWSVRGGSMTLVQAGALYFGTRETYIMAMAAILWREMYDCIDLFRYKKDAHKILFRVWWSPIGPMPPLASFNLCNVAAMVAVLIAD